MKLVYLHQYFNTPEMTGSTRSYEMAKRIAAHGHEVHVITSLREGTAEQRWRVEEMCGFYVHWVSVPYGNDMSYAKRVLSFIRFALLSTGRCISVRGDLIFATSTPLTIAIPALVTKWVTRKPMVFEVRDLWPDLPIAMGVLKSPVTIKLARWLERLAYKNAEHVVGCSPGMCDGVIRQDVDSDRVHNIPNSSDIELFRVSKNRGDIFRQQHDWLGQRPLVVYAGTFGRINGVEYLVRVAHASLESAPEIAFLVVGYGFDEQTIDSLAVELGVKGVNFYILPKQAKNRIPDIYSAASLVTSLFLPIEAMWANSANKFFDGLAAGKPIAINYSGWQAEIVEAEEIGVLLDPYSPVSAAEVIREVVHDDRLLEKMGANSSRLADCTYSRDKLAEKLINVLEASVVA